MRRKPSVDKEKSEELGHSKVEDEETALPKEEGSQRATNLTDLFGEHETKLIKQVENCQDEEEKSKDSAFRSWALFLLKGNDERAVGRAFVIKWSWRYGNLNETRRDETMEGKKIQAVVKTKCTIRIGGWLNMIIYRNSSVAHSTRAVNGRYQSSTVPVAALYDLQLQRRIPTDRMDEMRRDKTRRRSERLDQVPIRTSDL